MKIGVIGLGVLVVLTSAVAVQAQDDEATEDDSASDDSEAMGDDAMDDEAAGDEATDDASTEEAAPAEEAASDDGGGAAPMDGGRFRFGVAAGAGLLTAEGVDFTYYGSDLRFGWQINDALAVYAVPQLGYYKLKGSGSGLVGTGGLLGSSVVADYTIADRFFIGGGFGYAVLNSPAGAELHFRAGGYPLMGRSDDAPRRQGLMLGVDFRLHFVEGYTFVAPTFNIGYDAF